MSLISGVSHIKSRIRKRHIKDGTSKTYLLGEKYINPLNYLNGDDRGDDWSMFTGQQDDIYRATYDPPMQDRAGFEDDDLFGSAHSGGLYFAFCDGSVRFSSFTIDVLLFRQNGNRKDGQVTTESEF
jgi:prepilin-type processing-associated H-X9-DG protein